MLWGPGKPSTHRSPALLRPRTAALRRPQGSAVALRDFLGFAGFSAASSAAFGGGALPSARTKPLVTFSAINCSASALARVSVKAKAELTLRGSLRLAEKSVQYTR